MWRKLDKGLLREHIRITSSFRIRWIRQYLVGLLDEDPHYIFYERFKDISEETIYVIQFNNLHDYQYYLTTYFFYANKIAHVGSASVNRDYGSVDPVT
jgi:hypothetical protein